MIHTDFLIIGAGIAGLSFAIKIADKFPDRKILIITKGTIEQCNSRFAQGGIAAVISKADTPQSHFEDTVLAGDKCNSKEAVKVLVKEAPDRIMDLINWGVIFDKEPDGNFNLALEGGHSFNRILHFKDSTGSEIMRALKDMCLKKNNIHFLEHTFATELLTTGAPYKNECYGAVAHLILSNTFEEIISNVTVLATGGAAQVYSNTTNPPGACGDGIVLASRAGAKIEGMEFIQFHPTAFYNKDQTPSFLISEAVRGAGAIVVNKSGEDFLKKYDLRGSLAPRDIVSRAIYKEMQEQGETCVYLDCTKIAQSTFKEHFPTIYQKCISEKIEIERDYIPVSPSAHYTCGGIATDTFGRSSINRLFALGECSFTGVHGGNRLASNSLSEALVFAHRATELIDEVLLQEFKIPEKIETDHKKEFLHQTYHLVMEDIKRIMWEKAGIIKSTGSLMGAKVLLTEIHGYLIKQKYVSPALTETLFLVDAALLIVTASLNRTKNKGAFYNKDLEI